MKLVKRGVSQLLGTTGYKILMGFFVETFGGLQNIKAF